MTKNILTNYICNLELYVSVCTSGSFKPTLTIRIRFGRKMMALQIKSIYPYFKTYLCMCYTAALEPEYSSRQNLVVAFFRRLFHSSLHPHRLFILHSLMMFSRFRLPKVPFAWSLQYKTCAICVPHSCMVCHVHFIHFYAITGSLIT
jgi:hypothetical protein